MTNNHSSGGYFFKKVVSSNKKGFTLIELLAVIIILGVLMIIAIPSVTEYIQTSRKSGYIKTANQYINGARTEVNSANIPMFDTNTTYYLPASCVSLEKGGDSPFGELVEAYVVVTYDGDGYDYYWTSRDSSNMGILLTSENLLDEDKIKSGITSINTNIGVGEREKIILINNCNGNDTTEIEVVDSIPEGGILDEIDNEQDSESDEINLYSAITINAPVDNVASTYVTSSTGIDFGVAPSNTNGKGLYIRSGTENDKYPIYYYRGAVTNNNVIFANFCWKIVRTTETGGIKLIYNGVPTDGKCNNSGTASQIGTSAFNTNNKDNAYVGYMYGTAGSSTYESTHANNNNSTIKTYIDNWYKTNIDDKGYTTKLEDTVWCNDRSFASDNTGTGIAKSVTYYGARGRVANSTPIPSLECVNANDKFTVSTSNGNGALTYPVALLTADEATLAGHGWNVYSSSSYLYTGDYWWSLSPGSFDGGYARGFYVYSRLYYGNVNYSLGVRPSVSLKPGTKFLADGDGAANNPYVIK